MEQICIHDDFFELGGDSLLATRFITQVRDTLQVDLPLRDLFERPTVADLAKQIEKMTSKAPASDSSVEWEEIEL